MVDLGETDLDAVEAGVRSQEVTRQVRESFEDFYKREFKGVVTLAYALSGSRTGSEDIAQEAFIVAHREWASVSEFECPEAWVRRVASNMAVSALRRRSAELRAMTRLRDRTRPLPELAATASAFWSEVRALPKRQAQVVALFYLEDRSVLDIGRVLGISEGTVKAHLHKARAKLAQRLGEEDPR